MNHKHWRDTTEFIKSMYKSASLSHATTSPKQEVNSTQGNKYIHPMVFKRPTKEEAQQVMRESSKVMLKL